jgi:TRAP transporter TAXI family solute receptor
MLVRLIAAVMIAAIAVFGQAQAQPRPQVQPAPPAPKPPVISSVGIVTGDLDSTAIQVASDLSRVLDDGNAMRVIPIIGKGSIQNITDMLNLRGVDAAVLQSDVLSNFQKKNRLPGLENRLRYVTKLYSEEFHVLARMQYTCLADLSGRRVSVGAKDSGMAITAEAVFEAHQVSIQPVYLDHDIALGKLKAGEVDAVVYVGGKPSRAFDRITHKDRVHFLDVDYVASLQSDYLPGIMTSEDYPDLVAPNENISTIGVRTVMVVNNYSLQSERFRTMSRFVEGFFQKLESLKREPYSAKWREVDLQAPLTGWERFMPADRWLAANAQNRILGPMPQQTAQQLRTMLQKFVESQRGGSSGDREELFNQFVRWYQQQAPAAQ